MPKERTREQNYTNMLKTFVITDSSGLSCEKLVKKFIKTHELTKSQIKDYDINSETVKKFKLTNEDEEEEKIVNSKKSSNDDDDDDEEDDEDDDEEEEKEDDEKDRKNFKNSQNKKRAREEESKVKNKKQKVFVLDEYEARGTRQQVRMTIGPEDFEKSKRKGEPRVAIRVFYNKDGEWHHGKQGITLYKKSIEKFLSDSCLGYIYKLFKI